VEFVRRAFHRPAPPRGRVRQSSPRALSRLRPQRSGEARPVGKPASDLLKGIERGSSEYVFGGRELKGQLAKVFVAAGLHDARCHDLRRTYASTAAELGDGDATIAELLGHSRRGVTERHYVRRPDAVLVEAASRTGELIDKRLAGRQADVVKLSPAQLQASETFL
jgi:integrase